MPGEDWRGTPLQPIYAVACRRDPLAAAKCFGLYVMDVMIHRPETWTSEHFEKDGAPIKGRTYFMI